MNAASDVAHQLYPSIPARIKAAEIDALITLGFVFALIGSYLAIGRETPVIIFVCIAVVLLYEPVLVTRRGQTIGHKIMGFHIIDSVTRTNISFSKSLLRFVLKSVLGILSLIWAFFERRQQFLHDRMTASMAVMCVVPADELELLDRASDVLSDAGNSMTSMPSLKRRLLFIVLYVLGAFILLELVVERMFPDCSTERTAPLEQCYIIESIAGGLFVVLLLSIIAVGLKGGLPGARKVVAASSGSNYRA